MPIYISYRSNFSLFFYTPLGWNKKVIHMIKKPYKASVNWITCEN